MAGAETAQVVGKRPPRPGAELAIERGDGAQALPDRGGQGRRGLVTQFVADEAVESAMTPSRSR